MSSHFYIRDFSKRTHDDALSDKSLLALSETKSEHTIDAYESDWNDFCDWCSYHKKESFPTTPETIVNYINDLADYAKTATIRRRISALSENFNAAGLTKENPAKAWIVREALIGLMRQKGMLQKGKTPVYFEELQEMISRMDLRTLHGLRDRAILLIGFMGAFRRSELVSLTMEDIRKFPQGIVLNIKRSKTDQRGEGQQVGIPHLKNVPEEMDGIRALYDWLKAADIHDGPIFRKILKNGKVASTHLSENTVNLLVKKYAELIGLDPTLYGAHSLRHGFATYAALHGIGERLIMKQTRHKSVEMVRRYINEADVFTNNPLSKMFGE